VIMAKRNCPVIGLAGAIGAGKTAVAAAFHKLGALVIDADKIAHELLENPRIKERIARAFGPDIFENGRISRPALASQVFQSPEKVAKINEILHPAVIDEVGRTIASARAAGSCPAVVLDAPLIFEAGLTGLCDYIVFVDAAADARRERLASDRGWQPAEIERRQKFQDSLIYKRRQADYTVDNNGSPEHAARQVASIWEKIIGV